jgi:mannitol-1-phosphate 5-dehydrogenase
MEAVHFGAGNIGRGFIGQLLHEAGYAITFVDIQDEVVAALKARGRYDVILADEEDGTRITVDGVTALHSIEEVDMVVERLAGADLVTTAVGPPVLRILAPTIARGLLERARSDRGPVNVIACENMIGGSQALRDHVMENVPDGEKEVVDGVSGFPNAAVDRIVPEQTTTGVDVLVEPFYEWIVDASQVAGDRPEVPGITYVEAIGPYIERKLLTVNTGHATIAYLGYAAGKRTIDEALRDREIHDMALKTLEETGLLLIREHDFDPDGHAEYRRKVLSRFENPRISDDVTRVARTPIRKLGHNERFVSPSLRLLEMGHRPVHLATVIGAILRYDNPNDPEARELQETVKAEGERAALARYAGIEEDHPLADLVVELAAGTGVK